MTVRSENISSWKDLAFLKSPWTPVDCSPELLVQGFPRQQELPVQIGIRSANLVMDITSYLEVTEPPQR